MYKARDLLNYTVEQMWSLPDQSIIVEFDDGLLETTTRETIFSYYLWVFQRMYPETPLLTKHHIGNRRLGASTHADILGAGLWDAYDAYKGQLDIELLTKILYDTVNLVYNEFTYRLEAYVSTISILDFIDVVEHPEIKAANESAQPNQTSIDHTYSAVTKVLKESEELAGNAVAKAARSGLVSIGQILQCVSVRGFLSDISSRIFRRPIMRGYVHGIRSLYDSMIESRSAAKALMFAKEPLSAVEYFNRKMQLVAGTFKRIHMGDCGSTHYLPWEMHSTDLSSFEGKYYLSDNGTLQRISKKDRHLVGRTVQVRSALYCNHEDKFGVCSTCFGDLSLSVPNWTNQGHVSSTILGERASQNVLSTKHLDGSSKVDEIEIGEYESLYIRAGTDPNTLKLATRLEGKRVVLTISAREAKNLTDVTYSQDVSVLTPARITQLTEVKVNVYDAVNVEETIVSVSVGNRLSSLTAEMLAYLKLYGWSLTPSGDYEIDLRNWDVEAPIFELPLKHLSMVDHMKTVESMIKAPAEAVFKGGKKKLDTGEIVRPEPVDVLLKLYKLVRTKLTMNIAHLEIILRSMMIESEEERKYGIPRNALEGEFGVYADIMRLRSMSALMAYQGQVGALLDVRSFIVKNRPAHPLDPLLMG